MEQAGQASAPKTQPLSPEAVLGEHLAQCRNMIAGCFDYCGRTEGPIGQQLEVFEVTARLMRVSVALAGALDKSPREFVHRVIVERPAARELPADVTPCALPPPPVKKSNSIPAAAKREGLAIA